MERKEHREVRSKESNSILHHLGISQGMPNRVSKPTMVVVRGPKEPLQYWICGGNHMLKGCPHRKETPRGLHKIDEVVIVEDMVRESP